MSDFLPAERTLAHPLSEVTQLLGGISVNDRIDLFEKYFVSTFMIGKTEYVPTKELMRVMDILCWNQKLKKAEERRKK